MSLILVFTIYMIFYAITFFLCFIMFICPFVGPLIWTNTILSYFILSNYKVKSLCSRTLLFHDHIRLTIHLYLFSYLEDLREDNGEDYFHVICVNSLKINIYRSKDNLWKKKKSWYLVVPYSEWSPLGRKENKPDVASCVNYYEMKSEWLRWENVECIHPNTIETDEVPMVQ